MDEITILESVWDYQLLGLLKSSTSVIIKQLTLHGSQFLGYQVLPNLELECLLVMNKSTFKRMYIYITLLGKYPNLFFCKNLVDLNEAHMHEAT